MAASLGAARAAVPGWTVPTTLLPQGAPLLDASDLSAIVVRTADPSRRAVLVTEDAARTKTVMKWLREQGLAPSTKQPT